MAMLEVPPHEIDEPLSDSIPEIPSLEIDKPKTELPQHGRKKANVDEIKEKGKQKRKNAAFKYFRKRDMRVTIAGLVIVCVLIGLYFIVALREHQHLSSFLYLLNSVVMLIMGYLFTKTTQR